MSSETAAPARPRVFWLFGLSGAGKSTLATQSTAALRALGVPVLALDGDRLRAGLCSGLAFGDEGRRENLRRAAEVARLALESNLSVVASFITPFADHRTEISHLIGAEHTCFVHVHAPFEVCRARDVKGLYAQASQGQVAQFTGLSSPFEPPERADLTIDTTSEPVEQSVARLLHFMRAELRC